jgi:hypothetical protein
MLERTWQEQASLKKNTTTMDEVNYFVDRKISLY